MNEINVFVPGSPAPKGSSRAMLIQGRAMNVPSGSNTNRDKLRSWDVNLRTTVAEYMHRTNTPMFAGQPLIVQILFRMARLKSHLNKQGVIKDQAPTFVISKPDVDKLARATLDSLNGIAFEDDSRIAMLIVTKKYVDKAQMIGAIIVIRTIQDSNFKFGFEEESLRR